MNFIAKSSHFISSGYFEVLTKAMWRGSIIQLRIPNYELRMQKICVHCSASFEITSDDLKFYDKISPIFGGKKYGIPPPTHCPDCRRQRKFSWRNERNLYHRKCDLTKKQIISMYSSDKPYKVYDQSEWWSDRYDPYLYGKSFDFSRTFFEQFRELFDNVPRINLNNKNPENSEYCNFAVDNKNCYLLFASGWNEDSFCSNRVLNVKNVCDSSSVTYSELCYEAIDSHNCYNCGWIQDCSHSSDCFFGYDLKSCQHCFACYSLNNAKYCIGNKQFSKEEYFEKIRSLKKDLRNIHISFQKKLKNAIRKYANLINIENCSGDNISHSKNSHFCFEVKNLEDSKFISDGTELKNCYDTNNDDHSELDYETIGADTNYHQCFSDICWFNSNIFYCSLCFNSKNLFGCVGMKKSEYCILNKQYSKEEYEKLVPKIIEYMMKDGDPSTGSGSLREWGEFFPASVSPFGYNESVAQEYFPLSKEEVFAKSWNWHEEEKSGENYLGPRVEIPENIKDVRDDICEKILICEVTGKPYKIIPQELKFYKEMGIPIPRKCPDQRHKERMALRNPRKLWERSCMKCKKEIKTSYAPERPEIVYCESCYLREVY